MSYVLNNPTQRCCDVCSRRSGKEAWDNPLPYPERRPVDPNTPDWLCWDCSYPTPVGLAIRAFLELPEPQQRQVIHAIRETVDICGGCFKIDCGGYCQDQRRYDY